MSLTDLINASPYSPQAKLALAYGTGLECNPALDGNCGCGDGGWSCGPWQINRHTNALGAGHSAAETANPQTALGIIGPVYERCSQGRDWSNPQQAAWETVLCAERPDTSQGYAARGPSAFSDLYHRAVTAIGGAGSTLPGNAHSGPSIGGVTPDTPVLGGVIGATGTWQALDYQNQVIGALTSHDTWIRALLVLGGGAGIIVGMMMILHATVGQDLPPVIPV